MTVGGIIAVGFLALMIALILRGVTRHPRGGDGSDTYYQAPGSGDWGGGDGGGD